MSRRFVLINQSLGPFFHETARVLAAREHDVTVITGEDCQFEHSRIQVIQGPPYARGSLAARAKSWARFLLFAAREVPRRSNRAVVLSSSNPPLLPHVCAMRLNRATPHVARVLDLYPEVLAAHSTTAGVPFVRPLWRALNRAAYRRCTGVVTLGKNMADTLSRSMDGKHPIVIPDWHTLDLTKVPARMENPLRRELGIGERLVVQYSGNLGLAHDLRIMVQAAESFRDDDRVRFVVIGQGPQRARLMAEVADRGLNRLFAFLPYQPVERLPVSAGMADLAVVTIAPGLEGTLMPCKTYNCLAAGSAVLAVVRRPGDLADVIDKYGCGAVIEPGDVAGFSAAIRDHMNRPENWAPLRRCARQVAEEHFSSRVCCNRLVELLEESSQ